MTAAGLDRNSVVFRAWRRRGLAISRDLRLRPFFAACDRASADDVVAQVDSGSAARPRSTIVTPRI